MTLTAAIGNTSIGSIYYVEGRAFNPDGSAAQPLTMQLRQISTGRNIGGPNVINSNFYAAWTETDPYDVEIVFSAAGMSDVVKSIGQLMQDPDIYFTKGSRFPIAAVVLVVAAVALYRSRTAKVGALTTGDIWPIFLLVGGVLAFDVFKRIMEGLSLWDSQDTKDLDQLATDPNSWWNPNYWQTVKPAGASYSYAITLSTAVAWAREIYNAIGPINDNEDAVFAVFKRCRTRANASYIAYAFQQTYGEDLLKWLRGGSWPQDRLSDADVNEITKYINKLPKY